MSKEKCSHPAFTCSKLIIETLDQVLKYVQSWQLPHQNDARLSNRDSVGACQKVYPEIVKQAVPGGTSRMDRVKNSPADYEYSILTL